MLLHPSTHTDTPNTHIRRPASDANDPLDFVWETQVSRADKPRHDAATVLNRLNHAGILEDKASFACLQQGLPPESVPTLETTVLKAVEVQGWLDERRRQPGGTEEWWILKAAGGNAGQDVYVLPPSQPSAPAPLQVQPQAPYIIQQYLTQPFLHENTYKFHFRVYAALRLAEVQPNKYVFQAWTSRFGFILRAAKPYHLLQQGNDENIHLTNLSLNKHMPGHPGQIPVDLRVEYPAAYAQMRQVWGDVVKTAVRYMHFQVRDEESAHGNIDSDKKKAEDAQRCTDSKHSSTHQTHATAPHPIHRHYLPTPCTGRGPPL